MLALTKTILPASLTLFLNFLKVISWRHAPLLTHTSLTIAMVSLPPTFSFLDYSQSTAVFLKKAYYLGQVDLLSAVIV